MEIQMSRVAPQLTHQITASEASEVAEEEEVDQWVWAEVQTTKVEVGEVAEGVPRMATTTASHQKTMDLIKNENGMVITLITLITISTMEVLNSQRYYHYYMQLSWNKLLRISIKENINLVNMNKKILRIKF